MGLFKQAFKKMAEGISDLSSLEVVTFEGSVQLEGSDSIESFDDVMKKAKLNSEIKVKVLASTRLNIDGDIVAFYDQDINDEQKEAHAELVDIGVENRAATIEMVKSIVGDVANL